MYSQCIVIQYNKTVNNVFAVHCNTYNTTVNNVFAILDGDSTINRMGQKIQLKSVKYFQQGSEFQPTKAWPQVN